MVDWLRYGIQGLLATALVGGAAAVVTMIRGGPEPTTEGRAPGPLVEVERVVVRDSFSAPIVGYGTVRAPRIYSIRSQVSGKVIEVAPAFDEGRKVSPGTVLFRIETSDLELARVEIDSEIAEIEATMAQTRTEVAPIESEIRRLRQSIADNERLMATRRQALDRALEELAKEKSLRERGISTDVKVKAFQDKVNQRQEEMQAVEAAAAQLPIRIETEEARKAAVLSSLQRFEANREIARARRRQIELDLTRTDVVSPAEGLVLLTEPASGRTARRLSTGDVVEAGLDAAWILPTEEGMEIPVPIRTESARWIRDLKTLLDYDRDAPGPGVEGVRIEWVADPRYVWEGTLLRFTGTIDTSTRRLMGIVHVAKTGDRFVPDEAAPLTAGMYCRVLIPGVEHSGVAVVPRRLVREDHGTDESDVLIVADPGTPDAQGIRSGRLEIRRVEVLRRAGDLVVVAAGLKSGEFLVASPLPEVVPGMALRFRNP